jgi:Domain of unknown function (DUF4129)
VRSAPEPRRAKAHARASGMALAAIALLTVTAAGATEAMSPEAPTRAEVAAAVAKLKADPNLGADKQTRKLVRNTRPKPDAPAQSPSWLHWIADAFAWLAGTARALLWMAGILLVGVLGLYIKRFVESRGERSVALRFSMPTHVRDLDIRPGSLPDDIGRAALELWERAEHRPALALLYRGLLSRLVHVHGVPIRDSSTEGDCLTLAAAHLPATRLAYAGRLIRVWQRAVYGNAEPSSEEFRALCAGFAAAADAPVADPTAADAVAERAA